MLEPTKLKVLALTFLGKGDIISAFSNKLKWSIRE